jgi:hypothetical protein
MWLPSLYIWICKWLHMHSYIHICMCVYIWITSDMSRVRTVFHRRVEQKNSASWCTSVRSATQARSTRVCACMHQASPHTCIHAQAMPWHIIYDYVKFAKCSRRVHVHKHSTCTRTQTSTALCKRPSFTHAQMHTQVYSQFSQRAEAIEHWLVQWTDLFPIEVPAKAQAKAKTASWHGENRVVDAAPRALGIRSKSESNNY